jgi:chromosome segregation ATPase
MSKIVSAERHDEVMEKLDTLACQLHHLGNATKSIGKTILANGAQPESPAFWEQQCRDKEVALDATLRKLEELESQNSAVCNEILRLQQQCREKDATLTEALRKLQAAEAQVTEVVGKNSAYVDEILRQREAIAELNVRDRKSVV